MSFEYVQCLSLRKTALMQQVIADPIELSERGEALQIGVREQELVNSIKTRLKAANS